MNTIERLAGLTLTLCGLFSAGASAVLIQTTTFGGYAWMLAIFAGGASVPVGITMILARRD